MAKYIVVLTKEYFETKYPNFDYIEKNEREILMKEEYEKIADFCKRDDWKSVIIDERSAMVIKLEEGDSILIKKPEGI